MKVAFVFDQLIFGGIERVGINYLRILVDLGYQVDVYILNPKTESLVNEIPKECSIKIIRFSHLLCPEKYWYIAKRWNWGKFIFPLVHLGLTLLFPFVRIIKGPKKEYDLAIAFSGHMNDLTFVTSYIKATKKIGWVHGSINSYLLLSPGYQFLYNKIKNLVVLSEDSQIEAFLTNKLTIGRIEKIYNPIFDLNKDSEVTTIEKLKKQYGDFALMVGRISPQKDHFTVIQAIKILKEKYGKYLKTVFVGDGPLRKQVEEYAIENGVSDLIIFEGTREDVQNYYKAAKIFIHSSPSEGLPTVLLEAMAAGLPIVATDSKPGVREILGENDCGLICPIKEPEKMAQKVCELLDDDDLYNQLIIKGKQRIGDFSPEAIKVKLNNYIKEIRN
ncbi:hypothetical protein A8F94_10855 [Bacillus sp. FJAT-27225]|uniref:glycosyltransferase n=1 Tax=Bacillus sp. FJAT-27225 TaxID=1743144 RepID=UPI00080C271B|nr:glycosyltransferase [Bacillus sp. FJAT-27225]OCA88289.1 hypothetical protein A8F94_10855 [Bacillus sp. FJAT-27225]